MVICSSCLQGDISILDQLWGVSCDSTGLYWGWSNGGREPWRGFGSPAGPAVGLARYVGLFLYGFLDALFFSYWDFFPLARRAPVLPKVLGIARPGVGLAGPTALPHSLVVWGDGRAPAEAELVSQFPLLIFYKLQSESVTHPPGSAEGWDWRRHCCWVPAFGTPS